MVDCAHLARRKARDARLLDGARRRDDRSAQSVLPFASTTLAVGARVGAGVFRPTPIWRFSRAADVSSSVDLWGGNDGVAIAPGSFVLRRAPGRAALCV